VDDTAALAIEEMLAKAVASGKRFYVCGASDRVMAMFTRLGMQDQMAIAPDASRQMALEAALA
jgi:anti-anti-sigma regulatory factor